MPRTMTKPTKTTKPKRPPAAPVSAPAVEETSPDLPEPTEASEEPTVTQDRRDDGCESDPTSDGASGYADLRATERVNQ
jgi:hypothetical protein